MNFRSGELFQSFYSLATLEHVRLSVRLRALLLLTRDLSPDDVLPHVVLLGQVEEPPNLRRPLRAESLGQNLVGQPRDLVRALADDSHGEHGNVGSDDAAAHGLALALARAARAETRVPRAEQETHAVREEHALLHGEALLVIPARNAQQVARPLVTERVGGDFLRDALVEEDAAVGPRSVFQ